MVNFSKKGNENEDEKSSDERVLEGSNKNGQRDEQELPEDLHTCPCENARETKGKDVVRVRVQKVPPIETQNG